MLSKTENAIAGDWIFPKLWAGFLLLFVGVTAPLWFPADRSLLVPMPGVADSIPVWFDTVFSVAVCTAALAVIFFSGGRSWFWWIIAASLVVLFLLDQRRLQPWAYQTAIYATLFASMKPAIWRRWLMPMAASIYIYSALGKFDYQFVHTVGVEFLAAIARPIGGLSDDLPISTWSATAYLFPATELVIGLSLLPKPSRRVAGMAAMLMHASLIGILGPWGLNHSAGVLVWNLLLMIQSWFLFVSKAGDEVCEGSQLDRQDPPTRRGANLARLIVLIAILMPILERRGYWDHWPSWALYSPHNSRFEVELHGSGIRLLSASMSPFVEHDDDGDGWHSLALDRWSLETQRVPIYPQARYQLGLAVAVARSRDIDGQIRGRLRGVSNRKSGKRKEKLLVGRTELERATKEFWLLPHAAD